MRQVLFWIPLINVPVFGFGMMLFLSFVISIWWAGRRAERENIARDRVYDLTLWVFGFGIIGARIVYMIQYQVPWQDFYKIWEGGIVFYGSAVGGWVGYFLAWRFSFRKYGISTWKLADTIAPVVCVGLLLGRIGCFINGCCYGHLCPDNPVGVQYPLMTAPAWDLVVVGGYQTKGGFTLDEAVIAVGGDCPLFVGAVEPNSPAARAGLRRGDAITKVNEIAVNSPVRLHQTMLLDWPRGATEMTLSIVRDDKPLVLPTFVPRTLKVHPTQLYESISMALLCFLLCAFYPYRRHYGQVFVVLMLGYPIHRFINEQLRDDTNPIFLNLTLSQIGSLAVFVAGLALELVLRQVSPRADSVSPPPAQPKSGADANRV